MDGKNVEDMQVSELSQCNWRFEAREEMIITLSKFYSSQGYAIVLKNSHKDKYMTIGCDRGSVYRKPPNVVVGRKERATGSRLINCPFEIKCKKGDDGFWVANVRVSSHNHNPSSDMSGHPSCRRLSMGEIDCMKEMTSSGIAPRQILSSLRKKNPELQAVSRTVYNLKAKIYKDNLAGRSIIQALFEEFQQGDFTYYHKYDEDGHLTHLFFAHPSSIALTRSYSNVFVMDCTYKTNKYKMSLLDIIGVSSFNSSFYSCFVFLKKEGEEDYVWALRMFSKILDPSCHPKVIVSDRELALMNAIQVIFPKAKNLLCVWHIDKNVLTHCKPCFEMEESWTTCMCAWKQVTNSHSEAAYEEAWNMFEMMYKDKEKVISYLKSTWLPMKGYFVKAWTEKHTHFGNRVTSREEGAHAKLKKYLQVSTGDLRQVKNNICLAIKNEFKEIMARLSSESIRVAHKCRVIFFEELITRVSTFAMEELLKQYEMVTKGTMQSTCTGHFKTSMGLPYAHMMMAWKGKKVPLNAIHSQWRIDTRANLLCDGGNSNGEDEFQKSIRELQDTYEKWPLVQKERAQETISQLLSPSLTLVIEPTIGTHRGRPSGSKKRKESSSTRRDPSHFEIVEARRKCTTCGEVGHNSRTCQKMLVANEFAPADNVGTSSHIDLNVTPISTTTNSASVDKRNLSAE